MHLTRCLLQGAKTERPQNCLAGRKLPLLCAQGYLLARSRLRAISSTAVARRCVGQSCSYICWVLSSLAILEPDLCFWLP